MNKKNKLIHFSKPLIPPKAKIYLKKVLLSGELAGDYAFTKKCHAWLEKHSRTSNVLLTTSCTHALEMAAILIDIKEGDEVIMPSYTFSSTANAFILRGAKIVFVDIRPDTMNIDEALIKQAITKRTKAIIPVHYAGVGCEMNTILKIAENNGLYVIEDAAQGMMSSYKNKPLGSIGDIGVYSFHETKNYVSGEGGAIILNNDKFKKRAEIIREKGTNRSQFFRGEVNKYSWQDIGSSYLPSELNAALLLSQLEMAEQITKNRLKSWDAYYRQLVPLAENGNIDIQKIPDRCEHNGHMFYIKLKNLNVRTAMINYLRKNSIYAVFHYIPLHSSKAGKKYGRFCGNDRFTTLESEKLMRLPLYFGITNDEILYICEKVKAFFGSRGR